MGEGWLGSLVGRLRGAARPEGLGDAELLRRWSASRDESAFELIVWRHGRLVWAACRRLLADRGDAEDAFQATFLLLVRKAHSIRAGQALPAWLHTVATRVARAARKKADARPPAALAEAAAPPAPDGEVSAVLDEEVAALPERFRAAFVLCELMGVTQDEAAAQLGCPVGTVASRLGRARQKLRERLARRGLGPEVPALALPALPAALPALTLNAALSLQAGSAVAPGAAALMTEVLNAMLMTKVKAALVAGVTVVALGLGGLQAYQYAPGGTPLEKARLDMERAAAEVKRLEAVEKARAVAPIHFREVIVWDGAPARRAKVDEARAMVDKAISDVQVAKAHLAAMEQKKAPPEELALAAAQVSQAESARKVTEAALRVVMLELERAKQEADRAAKENVLTKEATTKPASLEQRFEVLEKRVKELEEKLKRTGTSSDLDPFRATPRSPGR